MSINFSDLMKTAEKEGGFSLLPDGSYNVVVEKAQATTASTGKPMLKVTLVVTDGPSKGRKLFTNHVLATDNPNALAMFFRNMGAYGLDKAFWNAPGASLDGAAAIMVGRPVTADVGHKVYQGEDRNEVKGVKPPAAGAASIMGPAVAAPTVNIPQANVPSGVPTVPTVAPTPTPEPATVPNVPVQASGDEEPF